MALHEPIAPGHFWYDHNFLRAGVCQKEILEIDVPRDVPVKLRNSDLQPSVRDEGLRRVYTFENANLKKKEEIPVLTGLKYPQCFPDSTPVRIIRKAILSCSIYSKNCTLVLMLPTDAAVPAPFPVLPAPTN